MTQRGDLGLNERLDRIEGKLDRVLVDVGVLKAKAAYAGALAGLLISSAVTALTAIF